MQKVARVTGFLYLLIIVCAGFSEGYVRSGLIVPGDAAATAANIAASESPFGLGLVTDLIAFLSEAAVAVLFVFAAIGYLTESLGSFLFPDDEAIDVRIVAVPAATAELSSALWLLVKCVDVREWARRAPRFADAVP